MDGDEFVHSSIGKMFIEKGASEEELSSLFWKNLGVIN